MPDTVEVTMKLDPEVIKHKIAAAVVKLGVEDALREGISSWALTRWIEQAARTRTMEIVADCLEPVLQPIIEKVLKEKMTEEWINRAVEEFIEAKLNR
ncbi:hypothetical protein LCGC14_2455340 [marine sediment metagenome]|uniref:Uncharacterized protein n=1 Tax=marine sediment metagenome TaxID=412755 RepID=A0A0F9E8P7_9ZZZZ